MSQAYIPNKKCKTIKEYKINRRLKCYHIFNFIEMERDNFYLYYLWQEGHSY